MENRLATIVFIDMQGYTKRSAQQTIEEMKLFHDEMFNFVKTHLEKYQGIMVKTLGDGFLARFDSPTQAVQCGLEMQRRIEARNAQMLNPDSIVRFRIGLNTGEIGIDESGDVFGDPVNIASRIQSYAEPNEVYISESTFLAMNRNEVGAQDLGMQMFKNATREIRIYKILKQGSPGLVLPAATTKGSSKGLASGGSGDENAPAKIVPAWQTWLKVAGGIFVVLMFLNGVKHTFRRQPTANSAPNQGGTVSAPAAGTSAQANAQQSKPGQNAQTDSAAVATVAKPVTRPGTTPPVPPTQPPTGTHVAVRPNPVPNTNPDTANPPADGDGSGEAEPGNHTSPLEIDPDNPPPRLGLNQNQKKFLKELKGLQMAGKTDEALKLAEDQAEAVKQAPPNKQVDYNLLMGQLYLEAGKKQLATGVFNRARELTGQNPFKRRILEMRIQAIHQIVQKKGK